MTSNVAVTTGLSSDPLLRLRSVTMAFGGLVALRDVDLDVAKGERLAVLGPNGAGKTTLFNIVAGDFAPTDGSVQIKGIDCTELPSRFRPALGVARTYQKTRLFPGLTVEDNLYLAQAGRRGVIWPCGVIRPIRLVASGLVMRLNGCGCPTSSRE